MELRPSKPKRTSNEIMMKILQILKEEGSMCKSALELKANLNHSTGKKYFTKMKENGWLEIE